MEYIKTSYDEYVMKGAKSTPIQARFPGCVMQPQVVPQRGRDVVPRRIYTKPKDYGDHGYTPGCKRCIWMQTQVGPRVNHSEACRRRIEEAIAANPDDDRTRNAKERSDHYAAQRMEEDIGPRPEGEPNTHQEEG